MENYGNGIGNINIILVVIEKMNFIEFVFIIVLYCLFVVIIIIGNGFILIFFVMNWKLRIVINMFIVSLLLSDIFVGFVFIFCWIYIFLS